MALEGVIAEPGRAVGIARCPVCLAKVVEKLPVEVPLRYAGEIG